MGLFVRQDDNRSELQNKVAADLQQKIRQTAANEGTADPEPKFLENQHETRPAGMVIGILILILITVVLVYIVNSQLQQ